MAGNGLVTTNAETDYKVRYENLGAAITQMKVSNTASHEYLSCASTSGTSTNQCFDEQAGVYKTRFYLQKVGEANESEMGFKKSCTFPSGNTFEDDNYFYTSLYVPYDVILPDGAVAFLGVQENREEAGNYRLRSWSTGWYDETKHQDANGKVVDNDRFVPSGVPVVIRAKKSEIHTKEFAVEVSGNTPTTPPEAMTSVNKLQGTYLSKGIKEVTNNQLVYVFTKSNKGNIGFFKNNTTVPEGMDATTNTFVPHNRIYFIYNKNGGSSAKSMYLSFEEGQPDDWTMPTGIDNVESNYHEDGYWYSVQGIRLQDKPTRPGVYIHNGKKVTIK